MPSPLSIAPDAVAIDYVVDGPRTAAALAAGRSRPIGMTVQEADQEPYFIDQDLAGLLQRLGDRPRLYPNSLFAFTVEAKHDLPPPASFHDFHVLASLLYGQDPSQWQPKKNTGRSSLIDMSLRERRIPFASYAQFLNNVIQEQLDTVYEQIELPVIAPTLAMTLAGVPFNTDTLERLRNSQEGTVQSSAAALLSQAQPDGRIYANLDPLGASTGRFSCESPNLQGIPGRLLEAIEASPGRMLLEADYSQCELRVLAHFSQDPRLLAAYNGEIDVHSQTAAAVLGIPVEEVTPEQRKRFGKEINFAIIYGMTPEGLAQQIGIPTGEAQALLDAYFIAYPGVQQWIALVHDFVRAQGHVRTLYGRRRKLPGIWSASHGDVAQALRRAVNTIIQGTAADLIKLSLVRLHDVLPAEVRMLMTAHDSVLLELPEPPLEETRQIVRNAMETLPSGFTVPLKVDLKTGRTWAECKRT